MEVLGGRVGTLNDADTNTWLQQQVDDHKILFDGLQDKDMSKQIAMLLLRYCGLPLLNYICRVLPPQITNKHAVNFDGSVRQCFSKITGITSTEFESASNQIYLPFNAGGCGFRRYSEISAASYIASLVPFIIDSNTPPASSSSTSSSSSSSSSSSTSSSPI